MERKVRGVVRSLPIIGGITACFFWYSAVNQLNLSRVCYQFLFLESYLKSKSLSSGNVSGVVTSLPIADFFLVLSAVHRLNIVFLLPFFSSILESNLYITFIFRESI